MGVNGISMGFSGKNGFNRATNKNEDVNGNSPLELMARALARAHEFI